QCIFEVELRSLDERLIRSDGPLQLTDGTPLLIELLLGLKAGRSKLRVALQVELCGVELSFILLLVRLRLLQSMLKRPRIDLEERVANLHLLTFVEKDLRDLPVDPAFHRNRVEGLDGPQSLGELGNVACSRNSSDHRDLLRHILGSADLCCR